MHGRIPRLVLAAPLAAALAVMFAVSTPFAMGGAETPALKSISSRLDGALSTVLIEASEPVAYLTSRPDPLTVFVDLRNVSAATMRVERRFSTDLIPFPRTPGTQMSISWLCRSIGVMAPTR